MDGVVTLLKPPGMTSSNAVYDVRRVFSEKRVGHLGTLDPGAAGVLPVCLGRATRLFDFLVDKKKRYLCEIAFGRATDTQDAYGAVIETDTRVVERSALVDVLPRFIGTIEQTAPVYSALKVDGKKMCDLARAGAQIAPRVRQITVSELSIVEQTAPNRYLLSVECSRGTYVRTLCVDIGKTLGTCAYMSFLLRTAAGPFTLENAYSISELEALREQGRLSEAVVRCEDALSFLPEVTLESERRTPTMNGLDTFDRRFPDGHVRVYCDGFLGVGTVENNRLRLAVHLY